MDSRRAGSAEIDLLDVLVLRLEAPLLSFGTVAIDERRPTGELPGRSMLTGLLANALGWDHRDAEALQALQARLRYAVRQDRAGTRVEDYQTVDLGQEFLHQGWTTRSRPEGRKGGTSKATHIRQRHFLADAAFTVALTLDPLDAEPRLDAVEKALRQPARPLFLERKCCLPSRPLVGHSGQTDRRRAPDLLTALVETEPWVAPVAHGGREGYRLWWPGTLAGQPPRETLPSGVRFDHSFPVFDDRDWHHQFHAGRRFVNAGHWHPPSEQAPEGHIGAGAGHG